MNRELMLRIVRFLVAGSLATAVSATVLQICVSIFDMWYVLGSVFGFFAGFFVSFTLQKFWTFRDKRRSRVMAKQAFMYLSLIMLNLLSNTALVYAGVEFGKLPPVVAQIFASLILAVQNFFVYTFVIFRGVERPDVLEEKASNPAS